MTDRPNTPDWHEPLRFDQLPEDVQAESPYSFSRTLFLSIFGMPCENCGKQTLKNPAFETLLCDDCVAEFDATSDEEDPNA